MDYKKTTSPHTLDDLLRETMTVSPSAVEKQNQQILANISSSTRTLTTQEPSKENIFSSLWKRLRILVPVPVLCLIFVLLCSMTVYAAVRFLSADESAEEMNYHVLAKAFQHENALEINETQSSGGLDITLLGITFGSAIQDILDEEAIASDQAYAIVALSRTDGTPLPDLSLVEEHPDEYVLPSLYISFLAKGYSPIGNPLDQGYGGTMHYEDGVYYQLTQCHGLSDFAGTGIYLSVTSLAPSAFHYDETSGVISLGDEPNVVQALFELSLDEKLLALLSPSETTSNEVLQNSQSVPTDETVQNSHPLIDSTIFGSFPEPDSSLPLWTEEQLHTLNALSLDGVIRHITKDRILTIENEIGSPEKTVDATIRVYDWTGILLHQKDIEMEAHWPLAANYCYTDEGFAIPSNGSYLLFDYELSLIGTVDPATIPTEYSFQLAQVNGTLSNEDGSFSTYHYTYPFAHAMHCSFSTNLQYFLINIRVNPTEHSAINEAWLYDINTGTWTRVMHDAPDMEDFYSFSIYCFVPSDDGRYAAFTGFYLKERISGIPQSSTHCYGLYSLKTGEVLMYRDGEVNKITSMGNRFFLIPSLETTPQETKWYSVLDPATMTEYRISSMEDYGYYTAIASPDGRYILFYHNHFTQNTQDQYVSCCLYDTHTGSIGEPFTLPMCATFQMYDFGYVAAPYNFYQSGKLNHIFGTYQ